MPINMQVEYPKLVAENIILRTENQQLKEDYNILVHKFTDAVAGNIKVQRLKELLKKQWEERINLKYNLVELAPGRINEWWEKFEKENNL